MHWCTNTMLMHVKNEQGSTFMSHLVLDQRLHKSGQHATSIHQVCSLQFAVISDWKWRKQTLRLLALDSTHCHCHEMVWRDSQALLALPSTQVPQNVAMFMVVVVRWAWPANSQTCLSWAGHTAKSQSFIWHHTMQNRLFLRAMDMHIWTGK